MPRLLPMQAIIGQMVYCHGCEFVRKPSKSSAVREWPNTDSVTEIREFRDSQITSVDSSKDYSSRSRPFERTMKYAMFLCNTSRSHVLYTLWFCYLVLLLALADVSEQFSCICPFTVAENQVFFWQLPALEGHISAKPYWISMANTSPHKSTLQNVYRLTKSFIWVLGRMFALSRSTSDEPVPSVSPTGQSIRRTELDSRRALLPENVPVTSGFVRLPDWPFREEGGSLYLVCSRKSNVYQPPVDPESPNWCLFCETFCQSLQFVRLSEIRGIRTETDHFDRF